jgi:hypothetical protein
MKQLKALDIIKEKDFEVSTNSMVFKKIIQIFDLVGDRISL